MARRIRPIVEPYRKICHYDRSSAARKLAVLLIGIDLFATVDRRAKLKIK